MSDLIDRQAVLKLLYTLPPEEAMTKAMLIQSVKQMDSETVTECNDLISRRAALKALKKNRFPGAHYIDTGVKIALREIKALPSVQPYTDEEIQKMQDIEQAQLDKAYEMGKADAMAEIIRCRDCKYNDMPPTAGNAGCTLLYGMTNQNGFCSLAERREVSE